MKKVFSVLLGMLFLFSFITMNPTFTAGKTITGGVIVEGRTLLPMRSLFENIGATVHWDSKTKKVFVENKNIKIEMPLNSKQVKVNGSTKKIDVPAKLINNRTMIPLRFISETLGASVSWDNKNFVANVKYQGNQIEVLVRNESSYMPDPNKVYTYKHSDLTNRNGPVSITYETVEFKRKEGNAYIWSGYTWKEDSTGLWVNIKDDDLYDYYSWYQYIPYPVKLGTKWEDFDGYNVSIANTSATIVTEAGTFHNCVVINYDYKILTFKKGVGLIRMGSRDSLYELVSIKNK